MLIAGLVGVPLIRRAVARDWEELERAEAIPELHAAGEGAKADVEAAAAATDGSDGSEAGAKDVPAMGAGHPERTPAMLQDLRKSKIYGALSKSANFDIHGVVGENKVSGGGRGLLACLVGAGAAAAAPRPASHLGRRPSPWPAPLLAPPSAPAPRPRPDRQRHPPEQRAV